MLIKDLDVAVKEARRFLDKAAPLLNVAKIALKDDKNKHRRTLEGLGYFTGYVSNKQNAAVKRASLDLSNALADIRKNKR